MTDASAPTAYDALPYTSYPYPRTHPDRLAALATLFGLSPAPPRTARVLELGCAGGGNLVPMAEALPQAQFVGVDLSATQIEQARSFAAAAGVRNLALHHASILDVDASFGEFDYVLCHGVYSWVPPPVQQAILGVCRERMRPDGIAYVSYNTYPGWHMRELVRDMMRWHTRTIAEPRAKVAQARALVDFLADASQQEAGPYALLLRKELALLGRTGDDYLFHEHLEDCNAPVYFHEFVERIDRHGLRYLCESDLHTMLPRELAPEIRATLDRVAPDLVHMEQYLDFVRNRQFRASLLCQHERQPQRALGPERVMSLRFGFAPAGEGRPVDLSAGVTHVFTDAAGHEVGSARPCTKAALTLLRQLWPAELAFEELHARALSLRGEAGIVDAPAHTRPSAGMRRSTASLHSRSISVVKYDSSRSATCSRSWKCCVMVPRWPGRSSRCEPGGSSNTSSNMLRSPGMNENTSSATSEGSCGRTRKLGSPRNALISEAKPKRPSGSNA
jgi:SAM-dependent methyltransferase